MVEWVEVKGTSVDVAVKAALTELGIDDEGRAEVKVLQEPQRGFLGIGRQDAIVRVKPSSPRSSRKKKGKARAARTAKPRSRAANQTKGRKGSNGSSGKQSRSSSSRPGRGERKSSRSSDHKRAAAPKKVAEREGRRVTGDDGSVKDLGNKQAAVVDGFLSGLLGEFGLEGSVKTSFDGRFVQADVIGDQTEALIGPKANVMQAVHELTKTVVQRKTARNCRLRLDIAGYGERRRKALSIYATQLADQVVQEGGEVMLEPMKASDRKVVHDAVAAVDGVGSYSEGAEPRRSVVISTED